MTDNTRRQAIDNQPRPSLDWYARDIHATAVDKGFWFLDADENRPSLDKIMAKLALVHSEVTEILEAIRKSKGSKAVVEEMSDVLIRLLDLYGAMWLYDMVDESLQELFDEKMEKNKLRPALHGHKWG